MKKKPVIKRTIKAFASFHTENCGYPQRAGKIVFEESKFSPILIFSRRNFAEANKEHGHVTRPVLITILPAKKKEKKVKLPAKSKTKRS